MLVSRPDEPHDLSRMYHNVRSRNLSINDWRIAGAQSVLGAILKNRG